VKLLVKVVYMPFGIVFGLISGVVARKLFEAAWSKIDDREPPEPTTQTASWPAAVGAAALKSATFSATKAAGERSSAQLFRYLFGVWPGKYEPEKTEA
jgi:hypothetical protein